MSEKEFELYLSLLGRFLRLSPSQRLEIADELRDHLEERLEELIAEGLSRDEAIHQAIDEFGDASELATHFTHLARRRKRRLIMRLTAGTALTATAAILIASLLQPELPPQNAGGRVVAQQERVEDSPPAYEEAQHVDETERENGRPALTTNESVEEKLKQPLDARIPDGTTLADALDFVSHEMQVDIYPDWDGALADEQIDRDMPTRLEFGYTTVSAETVLDLLLEPLQVGYLIRDGFIYVTTQIAIEEEEDYLEFRVYNVRDLLQPEIDTDEFMKLVRFVNNAPWEDEDGVGGNVQWYDGMLAIRQTQKVHRQIEDVFAKLRAANEEHAWGPERPEFKSATNPRGNRGDWAGPKGEPADDGFKAKEPADRRESTN